MIENVKRFMVNNKKEWCFFCFLLGILFVVLLAMYIDNDYWWHIKAGEYIVHHGSIPFTDVFSWYGIMHNLKWISHEWLAEGLLYIFKVVFGSVHPIIFVGFFLVLLFSLLYIFNRKSFFINVRFSLLWVLLGIIVMGPVLSPRPHMISYVLLAFALYLLFDLLYNPNSRKIYFLPLVSVLWANFHGGSSNLPYLLCLIFFFVGISNFKFGSIVNKKNSKRQSITYLLVAGMSFLAILVNPHGFQMLLYPYINMRDKSMLTSISEWRAFDINQTTDIGILILFLVILFLLLKSRKSYMFLHLSLLGCFFILTLKSIRFAPLLYIVSTFIIFSYVDKKVVDVRVNKVLLISSCCFFLFFITQIPSLVHSLYKPKMDDKFLDYIKDTSPSRLYNFYDYGGYLIYHDIKPFIDGRADMYSDYNFRHAYSLLFLRGDYEYILAQYEFDMFLLEAGYPLDFYLKSNDAYEEVLRISNTVLYRKN